MGSAKIILGIPGVGKSTVCKRVPNSISSVLVTDFADHMISDEFERDAIQYLSMEQRRPLFETAKERIGKLVDAHDGTTLVEAHFVLRVQSKVVQLGLSLLEFVKPSGLVLIDAPAEMIIERRRADTNRVRQSETLEEIRELQALCYLRALSISSSRGIGLSLVVNRDLDIATSQLCDLLNQPST